VPKLTPRREELRRQHIVAAAGRCFRHSGYGATTVDDVCREAGVSKGGLYTYFRSKEELFAQVCRAEWLEDFDRLAEAVTAEPTLEAKLNAYGDYAFSRIGGANPRAKDLAQMSLAVWHEAAHNPAVHEAVTGGYRVWYEALVALLRAEQRPTDGIRPELNVEALVVVLIAMFDGLQVARALARDELNMDTIQQALLALVKRGILSPAEREG